MDGLVVDRVDTQLQFMLVFKLVDLIEQDLQGGHQLVAGGEAQSQQVDRPFDGPASRLLAGKVAVNESEYTPLREYGEVVLNSVRWKNTPQPPRITDLPSASSM